MFVVLSCHILDIINYQYITNTLLANQTKNKKKIKQKHTKYAKGTITNERGKQ